MEHKKLKKQISKGERLGWSPLEKLQQVQLASINIRGRRLLARHVQPEQQTHTSYLIP